MMYFFAMIAGCMVVLSMVMNSRLARSLGVFEGAFINFAVGLVTSALVIVASVGLGAKFFGGTGTLPPWYAYGGALLGVAIVAASNIVIPRIPVVYSAVLIFLGQIIAGLALDAAVSANMDWHKTAGAACMALGLFINARIDAGIEVPPTCAENQS